MSDALRDLPVVLYKENTSSMWHREEQVRRQNPDLVISHLSCLLDQRLANADPALEEHLFGLAQNRLTLFFAYLGTANPRTRFLVYSRSRFDDNDVAIAWARDVVGRFPSLKGRLSTMSMPGGRASATFRDLATAQILRTRVKEILVPLERRWPASVGRDGLDDQEIAVAPQWQRGFNVRMVEPCGGVHVLSRRREAACVMAARGARRGSAGSRPSSGCSRA